MTHKKSPTCQRVVLVYLCKRPAGLLAYFSSYLHSAYLVAIGLHSTGRMHGLFTLHALMRADLLYVESCYFP